MNTVPVNLHHYYDISTGPFKSLTSLPPETARKKLAGISPDSGFFASRRKEDYLGIRFELEKRARSLFLAKGGKPVLKNPFTMTLGPCPWLLTWYPDPKELIIPLDKIPPDILSFSYGDLFPAFRFSDGEEHSGRIFTLGELPGVIKRYGLPQEKNPRGESGPKRYIEAQIWEYTILNQWRENHVQTDYL